MSIRKLFDGITDNSTDNAADHAETDFCACNEAANEHVLSEYYAATPDAKTALHDGTKALLAEHGGTLCIPSDATTLGFVPRNHEGQAPIRPTGTVFEGVTVKDARHGVERTYLPPVGDFNSELTAIAGRIEERDLSIDLGWQGVYSLDSLCSRVYGGVSSTSMRLAQATKKGGRRFYVPSLMGIFPGQRLKINLIEDPFTVAHLGEDATGPFFETDEMAKNDIPQGASFYNKHNVNMLSLSDTSNSDNQGASLNINRRAYGAGDVFLLGAVLEYQSNIYSALGDEGAVGCGVNLQHDLEGFHGVVESWTPKAGSESTVVYKTTAAAGPPQTRNTQKLGTSRPLINLNETKWKRDGVANVLRPDAEPETWTGKNLPRPDHPNGCILIRPTDIPPDWRKHVGSFIALAGRAGDPGDASEYYKKDEETPAGPATDDVYRWWHITDVQDANDHRVYLFVERVIQRDSEVVKSGPLLFRDDNYTDSPVLLDERSLRYIIAPGAWVSDVRHGVAGNVLGNEGAQPTDPRRILLAPGHPELAENDPITNPPGPDLMHPTGVRVRQYHHFPATGPGSSFLSENFGRVQVGAGLHVAGSVTPKKGETLPDALLRVQKDQNPHYIDGVLISGTSVDGIRIRGYTKHAALDLWQEHGDQNIVWQRTDAGGSSVLRADRASGDFVFTTTMQDNAAAVLTGSSLGLALTELRGLSGTSTRAHNLRGRQSVAETGTSATVTFPAEETDQDYHLFLQCTWLTQSAVVTRTKTGFEATFSVAAPKDAGFDWLLVR
jgi:hypothetical protein